jgi:hypothetical protein
LKGTASNAVKCAARLVAIIDPYDDELLLSEVEGGWPCDDFLQGRGSTGTGVASPGASTTPGTAGTNSAKSREYDRHTQSDVEPE